MIRASSLRTHVRIRWGLGYIPGRIRGGAGGLATNVENPGDDPAVISDAMILAAVQPMLTQEDT